ncbi:MAG: hypothetical protein EA402_14060 [Planctomycetota bacterium]|nr:MAG: hypothetical protein EA402_14060 [Planctomycetota bacterium]
MPRCPLSLSFYRLGRCALTGLLLINLHQAVAVEVHAPSADRWDPVQTLLSQGNDQAALAALDDIVGQFPRWGHGWMRRAEVRERMGQLEGALEDARRAHGLQTDHEGSNALLARLLVRSESYAEARNIHRQWLPKPDREGWIHYYAAEAAFAMGDKAEAADLIARGMAHLGTQVPSEFRFLSGRIHESQGDYAGAAAAFRRGLSDSRNHAGHWFNLGVIYRNLARQGDQDAAAQAVSAFARAANLSPNDPIAWFALGQSMVDVGDFVGAESNLSQALARFEAEGISQGQELALTHASFGLALLRLAEEGNPAGSHSQALDHLQTAERLGLRDAALYNNMLAAAVGAQRNAHQPGVAQSYAQHAEEIIAGPGADFISPVNLGMSYFYSARGRLAENPRVALDEAELAIDMFQRALADAADDAVATQRFLGHAHALAADAALAAAAGEDAEPAQGHQWQLAAEAHRDAARDAYFAAGNQGDGIAQRHYLARQSERGPQAAYAAGWQFLRWRSYIHPEGWKVVIANYGAAEAYLSPLSMALWGVILGLSFVLGCKAFFLPKPLAPAPARRSSPPPAPARKPGSSPTNPSAKRPEPKRQPTPTRRPPLPARDNRTTQDTPARSGQPTRRAVDDIARRMAQRSSGNGGSGEPPTRSHTRRRP